MHPRGLLGVRKVPAIVRLDRVRRVAEVDDRALHKVQVE